MSAPLAVGVPAGQVSAAATHDGRVVIAVATGETPTAIVVSWMDAIRIGRALTEAGVDSAHAIDAHGPVIVAHVLGRAG